MDRRNDSISPTALGGRDSDRRADKSGSLTAQSSRTANEAIRPTASGRETRMESLRLDGKSAIITGASRGIGRAIAELYARAGVGLVVTSRKLDACQNVVDQIRKDGGEATAVNCNISDKSQIEHLVE